MWSSRQPPTSKLLHKEQCPECASQGRDTSEDNLGVYDDGHSYCFSCEYYHSNNDRQSSGTNSFTYEFLPWRKITDETFRKFEAATKIDAAGKPVSIGFRYPNGDIKVRLIDDKVFYWVKQKPDEPLQSGLFGRDRFAAGSNKALIITEGELDALTCWQCLRIPSVSVRSSSSCVADCTVDRSWCESYERIYLALDGDVAGVEAVHRLAPLFNPEKLFWLKFDPRRKDANEYLQHGEEDALQQIFRNAKRYMPENIVSSFSDFKKLLEETPEKGISYPFPTLTEMTYGIRTGESVLITAPEGIGKTELMHAIMYQVLQETRHNVGTIFPEEQPARLLQALAGIHLKSPVHLPGSGYTPDQIFAAFKSAVQMDDRVHVVNHFGSSDPDLLLDLVRFLAVGCSCRVVMVDHIGMVISGMAVSADERRTLDYLITRLEMLVKELDFALILVSHVNDDGFTRSSRYISKTADIRIDLSRDVLHPDPIERNTTYLKISKNRFSGKTGAAGRIYFDPLTHTYTELADGETPEKAILGRAANDNMAEDNRRIAS